MDMSFMSKFLVQGHDAGRLLNRISANQVDGDPGMITYTQWLNERGTLEADLTVTKLDDERFWVVASDTAPPPRPDLDAATDRRPARLRSPTSPPATRSSTCRARSPGISCSR
jgi:glycine cleavage system aminomethyltransferase T